LETNVIDIINQILISKGLNPIENIDDHTRLREDLSFTSFDLAELTVKIEDQYDIDIFEDGIVCTIGELLSKIHIILDK
jgi:acyl carrier protein